MRFRFGDDKEGVTLANLIVRLRVDHHHPVFFRQVI